MTDLTRANRATTTFSPMKPLFIHYSIDDNFPPFRVDVAELFGREIPAAGHRLSWMMRRGREVDAATAEFMGHQVTLPGMSSRGPFGGVRNRIHFLWADFKAQVVAVRRGADLIQVRDKYISALFGLMLARMSGRAFIYWCSYPFPEHYLERSRGEHGLKKLYSWLHGRIGESMLYRFIMPRADHVFVQSDQMLLDLKAYGVPESKMTPVPMGVSRDMLDWASAFIRTPKLRQICYVGTLASVRRLGILIDAFAIVHRRFPEARLLIVGDGDVPQERQELEARASDAGLSHAVEFTGFIPMQKAWEIAANSAVCVSPIYPTTVLAAGSPTKLVEYMALGRPFVCNDHPEQSEITRQTGAGLCVEWGAKAFADGICWLFDHPDEAEAMAARGPAWVSVHRSYERIANIVLERYRSLFETVIRRPTSGQ